MQTLIRGTIRLVRRAPLFYRRAPAIGARMTRIRPDITYVDCVCVGRERARAGVPRPIGDSGGSTAAADPTRTSGTGDEIEAADPIRALRPAGTRRSRTCAISCRALRPHCAGWSFVTTAGIERPPISTRCSSRRRVPSSARTWASTSAAGRPRSRRPSATGMASTRSCSATTACTDRCHPLANSVRRDVVPQLRLLGHHRQRPDRVSRAELFRGVPVGRRALAPRSGEFVNAIVPLADKKEIIRRYELGLTRTLRAAGFRPAAYFRPGSRAAWAATLGKTLVELRWHPRSGSSRLLPIYRAHRGINYLHDLWPRLIAQQSPVPQGRAAARPPARVSDDGSAHALARGERLPDPADRGPSHAGGQHAGRPARGRSAPRAAGRAQRPAHPDHRLRRIRNGHAACDQGEDREAAPVGPAAEALFSAAWRARAFRTPNGWRTMLLTCARHAAPDRCGCRSRRGATPAAAAPRARGPLP